MIAISYKPTHCGLWIQHGNVWIINIHKKCQKIAETFCGEFCHIIGYPIDYSKLPEDEWYPLTPRKS